MPAPVEDEGPHPAGQDPDWQESAYLAWFDARAGLGGNHRIGNEPNRGSANLWCGVYHRDGSRFRHNAEGLALASLEHGLRAGPQSLFYDGTAMRFLLEADGCRVDLRLEDDEETFERSRPASFAGSQGPAGVVFSQNFHVFCQARGSVTLGRDEVAVEALAWRDHSWGVRRWDSFSSSRSFAASSGTTRFRYASMVGANGSFFRHGSVLRAGRPEPVESAQMLVAVDDDSLRCPSAEIRYRFESGETTCVRIETLGGMLGVTGQRCGWESVGEVLVDGVGGGWGFLEVNINPRQGRQAPPFALAEALTNGLFGRPC